ncbi:MAG: glycosyltransferase family 39 protein [Verrucomicrobia bacterium]|nr:glycosyltransferase family 39 protein [Verrucomicrobiota bacterium]MBU1733668.1 glycosyltransferase family 39 protein [Verrucomicrobiota bacterium]MBU1857208.1 glycosyltransferase family 39 protein [Verrucomicrobiota bacterium]
MSLLTSILPSRTHALAWLLLALLFAFGLFDHSLWSSNDTREGAMIREMVREGVWVTPVFNGQAYLEKPPLLHWTGVVLCKVFGRVNEGLVRLPAALYGFGALWIIGLWARDLGRERAGVVAAFLCATSVLYFEYSRIVLTDTALAFMVVLSLYLFWKAYTALPRRLIGWLAFLAVSAGTFYAKGLIGPGLVWVSVGAFLVYRREWKLIVLLGTAFSVVFALVLAPWIAALWHAGGGTFLYSVFWENQFGRFLAFNDPNLPIDPYYVHKESVLYYLFSLPMRLIPWTLLVMAALISWFRPKSPVTGLPALFVRFALVCMLALLHVSSSKAACYALPLFPIMFLMTGIWLEDTATRLSAVATLPALRADWTSALDRRLVGLTFGLVGVAALAVPLGYVLAFLAGMTVVWAPGNGAAIICFGLALMTLVVCGYAEIQLWKEFRAGQPACNAGSVATAGRRVDAILSAPMILAVLCLLDAAIFMPSVNYQRTYEPLVALVRQELNAGGRIALAGERERDLGALMFYLDSRLKVVSLTNAKECADFLYGRPGPAGIVVAESDLIHAEHLLIGKSYRIVQPMHGGHKSEEFRLLMNEAAPAMKPSTKQTSTCPQ